MDYDTEASDFEEYPFPDEPIISTSRSKRNPIKHKEKLHHKGPPRLTSIRKSVKSKEIIGFRSDSSELGWTLGIPKIPGPVSASDLLRKASHSHGFGELEEDMAQPDVNQSRNESPRRRSPDTTRTEVDKAVVAAKAEPPATNISLERAGSREAEVGSSGIYRPSANESESILETGKPRHDKSESGD
ncbi:hypothetical protein ACRALDRAFT_2057961 [Sodiomyces alcalophilus JCM 7366]|uniref:uncharacterized protein n=1 Tax=Sodiomyces alcalophilus JCM 7366 TaxID=591952 RepID=UPI0039B4B7C6